MAQKWPKMTTRAPSGQFGPFGAPLDQIWGYPPNPNWSQNVGLDMGEPDPTLFQAVPNVSDHWGLSQPFWVISGHFRANFG